MLDLTSMWLKADKERRKLTAYTFLQNRAEYFCFENDRNSSISL